MSAILAKPPAPSTSALGPPPPGPDRRRELAAAEQRESTYPNGWAGDPAHKPAYWIKISAKADGSFTVTNRRNGFTKSYPVRK